MSARPLPPQAAQPFLLPSTRLPALAHLPMTSLTSYSSSRHSARINTRIPTPSPAPAPAGTLLLAALLMSTLAAAAPARAAEPAPAQALQASQAAAQTPAHAPFSAAQIQHIGVLLVHPQWQAQASAAALDAQVIPDPDNAWVVTAPLGGVVVQIKARAGESVHAGAVLAELRSAEAPALAAELIQAQSSAELADKERARDRSLLAEGIIAQRRADASEAAAAQADATLAAVRTRLRLSGISEADARNGQVLARAPRAAVVLERLAEPGTRVEALSPLLRLADAQSLMLSLQLPLDAAPLQVGDSLLLPDGGHATVRSVAWAAEAGSQTRRVLASLPPHSPLTPGAWLSLHRPAQGGWSVPATAITRIDGTPSLFVQHGDGFDAVAVNVLGSDGEQASVQPAQAGALTAESQLASSGITAIKGALAASAEGNSQPPASSSAP